MASLFSGIVDSVKAITGATNSRRSNPSNSGKPQDGAVESKPKYARLSEDHRPRTYMRRAALGTDVKGQCPVVSANYYVAWIEDMCYTLRRMDIPMSTRSEGKLSDRCLKDVSDISKWEFHLGQRDPAKGNQWWKGSEEEVAAVNDSLTRQQLKELISWLWQCQTLATIKLDRIAQACKETEDKWRVEDCEFVDDGEESQICGDFHYEEISHQEIERAQLLDKANNKRGDSGLLGSLSFWKRNDS